MAFLSFKDLSAPLNKVSALRWFAKHGLPHAHPLTTAEAKPQETLPNLVRLRPQRPPLTYLLAGQLSFEPPGQALVSRAGAHPA